MATRPFRNSAICRRFAGIIDNLKIDLFPQEVFVFTPKGKIIKIPRGATIIDFAYAVHTDMATLVFPHELTESWYLYKPDLKNGVTVEVTRLFGRALIHCG